MASMSTDRGVGEHGRVGHHSCKVNVVTRIRPLPLRQGTLSNLCIQVEGDAIRFKGSSDATFSFSQVL